MYPIPDLYIYIHFIIHPHGTEMLHKPGKRRRKWTKDFLLLLTEILQTIEKITL